MTSTTSSLAHLKQQGAFPSEQAAVLASIENLEKIDGKIRCMLNDGKEQMKAILTSQVAKDFGSELKQSYRVKWWRQQRTWPQDWGGHASGRDYEDSSSGSSQARGDQDTGVQGTADFDIESLYSWMVNKAKVVNKGAKRTYNSKAGVPQHVCTIEVVDEEGTALKPRFGGMLPTSISTCWKKEKCTRFPEGM
eukprot:jgi/Picre1/35015/NNA_002480.t1